MPLDYSKWKTIEVSDDEDDTHPNIDTPSLFRWRHQARLERMAERKQEKERLMEGKSIVEKRILVSSSKSSLSFCLCLSCSTNYFPHFVGSAREVEEQ